MKGFENLTEEQKVPFFFFKMTSCSLTGFDFVKQQT